MNLAYALAALPGVTLALTLVNLATWTRGRPGDVGDLRVSALVPARNEEEAIEGCVRALLAEPFHEVIVCDDGSTDGTAARLEALAREDARVRVIHGRPLPKGWIGKAHACHQLAEAATGDVLCFVDADVRVSPGALGRIRGLLADADLLTAVPRQETGSLFEHMVLPLLHVVYVSWLPLALIPRVRDPRVLAANGQLVAMSRAAYDRFGGYAAVRDALVDDMALCRRAKESGPRVLFADGDALASCRMYRDARGVWEGFSKNLYEGVGGTPRPARRSGCRPARSFSRGWRCRSRRGRRRWASR
ncbi:MAG: glycosyltransferase family 2 protein [Polyangiales bacterium]